MGSGVDMIDGWSLYFFYMLDYLEIWEAVFTLPLSRDFTLGSLSHRRQLDIYIYMPVYLHLRRMNAR